MLDYCSHPVVVVVVVVIFATFVILVCSISVSESEFNLFEPHIQKKYLNTI